MNDKNKSVRKTFHTDKNFITIKVVYIFQQMSNDDTCLQSPNIRQIKIPGDIIIGGVFSVHAKSDSPDQPCGVIAETQFVSLNFLKSFLLK